ncbi:iron chelate uptake ABC transporter family permease subunit [Streptomyces cyaneofuscatus]|uniref:iron chelate uptake ABC transporter family permease subunit n=1 Tax=Streptomyces cyaneofuscatus TaxID=66883 RepID=UPI00365B2A27
MQLLPFIVIGLVIALLLARSLDSLALGDELGRALGARIARTRIAAVVVVTLLCGASTAAASVAAGAIAGGLATALVVSVLASRVGLHGIRLVFIGLGVTAMLGSVNSYLLTRSSLNDARNAHIWLVGTLNGRGWSSVQTMAVALVVLLPLVLLFGRRLRMMELGDDLATGPGVRVNRARLALTVLGIGLCGVAAASAGPIPFIAPAAPQIAVMVSRSPGVSLLSAVAVGAGPLSAAHLASSQLFTASGVGRRADRLDPGGRGVPAQQPAPGRRHHGRAGRRPPRLGAVQAARHRHRVSGWPDRGAPSRPAISLTYGGVVGRVAVIE